MHEDLNLIKQKQFNEIQDDAGPQEYWENFAQRNNSIISQNFNGQFKSQLTCPDCNRLSITYDPYYMVSLPVPQKDSVKTLKLTFIDVNNDNYFTDLEINYNKAEKPTIGEIMQITITHKKQEKNYSSFKETLVPLIKYYFNKNLTFKELHQQIFLMFKNFVSQSYDENLDLDQNLQNLLAIEQNENDKEQDVESQKRTPIYKITFESKSGMDDCMFCEQRYCRDCLLQYTDKFTLQDIYNNYEKNSYNKDFCPEFEIEWLKYDEKFNDENESNIFKVQKNLQDIEKSKKLNNQREKIEVEDEQKCDEIQNGAAAVQEEQKVDTELEYLNLNGYQKQQQQEQKKMDLYACLDHFQTPEKLDEFNEVYCRNCKEHKLMEKQMNIYSAPQIMIFHFKRFYRKNHNSAFMKKIQTNIDFPIEGLDLTKYVLSKQNPGVFDQNNIESNENENQDQNLIYDLFGVSNHSGSLMSGHYTAYCKNPLNQKWYYFNDSSVSEVFDINSIISEQAYVLFYRKRNSQLTFEELQNQIYDRLYQGMENKPEIKYPITPLDSILQEETQQMVNGVQKQNNKEDQNQI
ncbi:hypothetical protein PPERSA_08836 [Pseudocohnilembus persalinus]|uniref:ubiquitinyl hydrolase 1 n=1 Tax=Pseudocohnilembus persalinus TaxID=266149 RepID=A0A0V0R438_PSEPJ|nr:hypothetical protein PPERSA_08836 [Pseudocohnilembus persalinus]|eukprot:KRX09120.1 hypothetical protein PPERSA_08836 [Pseudocohnilembus persalinus]